MPSIHCLCGERINLSPVPNPQGLRILSEESLDQLIEDLIAGCRENSAPEDFRNKAYDTAYLQTPGMVRAYECPRCGRVAVFGNAADPIPDMWLQPEKTKAEGAKLTGVLRTQATSGRKL